MKKLISYMLALTLIWTIAPAEMAQAKKPAPSLEGVTWYALVAHPMVFL